MVKFMFFNTCLCIYFKKFIKNKIQGIEKASSKNAPTIGTIKNAVSLFPYLLVSVDIFARALGVAPSVWPIRPLIMIAASFSPYLRL